MEFLLVCKTKLKIILDKEETERYRLSDFTSAESRELRQRLSEILSEAKARVGFLSEGKRLLVSYYPTRLSGAELFVTAIDDSVPHERQYYVFGSLGELSRACRAIGDRIVESSAYLLPSGEYCLALSYPDGVLDVVSEFAEPTSAHRLSPLLSRSRCLTSEDAVALFARL